MKNGFTTNIILQWKNIKRKERWEVDFNGSSRKSCVHKGKKHIKGILGRRKRMNNGIKERILENIGMWYLSK